MNDLHDRRIFIVARLSDKHPVSPHTLANSDAQDATTWLTAAEAQAHVARFEAGYGVGLVLSPETKLACVDIDGAWDGAAWSPLALELIALFEGAYVEVSVSGRGLHIIFSYTGEFPAHSCKNTALHIECYHERRYILLTGTHAQGSALRDHTYINYAVVAQYFPPTSSPADEGGDWTDGPLWHVPGTADDKELLAKARRSKSIRAAFGNGITFESLWTADPDTLGKRWPPNKPNEAYDASSADIALANHCVWWTGGDCARVERLMRESELAVGRDDKWGRLLRGTILKALALISKNPPKAPGSATEPPAATEDDPRAVVLLTGGEFNKYAEQAEKLIADTIYVRGDNLVRIGRASEIVNSEGGIKRDDAQAVCISASSGWLRRELMARAQFWKFDKRSSEWEARDCPKELADNIGDQGAWSTFRPLIAVSPVPILRPDLSVWIAPGYDAVTGVYYQPTITFPTILPAPTREDALEALTRLLEPFDEFPFATPEARAAFLSHVISAILRPSFDTSPIYVYTAPIVATGKTLLARMANLIAHGTNAAQHPYVEKDELRKVLFAALLAGDPEITFDNVPNGIKVRADGLCVFATSGMYGDRILGVSENRKMPNRLLVSMSGNNITPAGDLSRRSLPVRLDAKAETARGRQFRIDDLPGYVKERRAQYIVDALTIVRAYACAGRPKVARPLESFEQWSKLVRDPLVWLGMADPVATQASETEDDSLPLPDAFAAIAAATATLGHRFTASKLASLVAGAPFSSGATLTLRDALIDAGCAEPSDAVKLGYWLREHRDRVAGEWGLERDGSQRRVGARWQLRAIK